MNIYILEIKNRILLIVIMWISLLITCFCYKETILFLSIKPTIFLYQENFLYFIATNLTDIFYAYIHVSYFTANQIIKLYILYNIFTFLAPALYIFEYRNFKVVLFVILYLWIFSFLILNIFILPYCWSFFLSFQSTIINQAIKIHFEAKITEYIDFYISLYSLCNGSCQVFLILFLFIETRFDKINFIKNSRKIIYFILFIIATLITPPDVTSQIIIGCSFILMYEFIIVFLFFKTSVISIR